MPVDSRPIPRHNLAETFELQKISTIAHIAGQLVYASMRMSGTDFHDDEHIEFPLPPERAAEIAEQVFNAAEARVLGAAPTSPQRSTPERLRIIRLLEKLRADTLDVEERAELVERIEAGV